MCALLCAVGFRPDAETRTAVLFAFVIATVIISRENEFISQPFTVLPTPTPSKHTLRALYRFWSKRFHPSRKFPRFIIPGVSIWLPCTTVRVTEFRRSLRGNAILYNIQSQPFPYCAGELNVRSSYRLDC